MTPAPSTATELITRSVYANAGRSRTIRARVTQTVHSECLNCGAALAGPFCSHCGQRVIPPHPTTKELVGDAYDEMVGWDGKFARTIRLLLTRPGELTRAAIEGQRTRYVRPVKLYLSCSVLFFLVQASVPPPDTEAAFEIGFGVSAGQATDQTPGERALGKAATRGLASLTPPERADLDREIQAQPWLLRPLLRAIAEDYEGLTRRASEAMPRVLFVLIPSPRAGPSALLSRPSLPRAFVLRDALRGIRLRGADARNIRRVHTVPAGHGGGAADRRARDRRIRRSCTAASVPEAHGWRLARRRLAPA